MIDWTLRQLEYVVAIADHGSFHAAARACAVTQPGLSAQVQQLESRLGVKLFERSRPRVQLTEAGREIVGRARRLLAEAVDLSDAARVHQEPLVGTLRLGVIPTVAPYFLPEALPRVRERHPRARFLIQEATTPELVAQLEEGRLDVLLLALEADLGEADTLTLFRDRFVAALPPGHHLAGRKRLSIAELEDEPLLLLDEGHCLRDQVLDLCRARGPQEIGDFRASSLGTLAQMVAGGTGLTLIPELACEIEGRAGLVLIPFKRPVPFRSIGLAWRAQSPRAQEFALLADALLVGDAPRPRAGAGRPTR